MAILGADIEGLQSFATFVRGSGSAVVGTVDQIRQQLADLNWLGPDADIYRAEWTEQLLRVTAAAEDVFAGIAEQAAVEAAQQAEASGT